MVHISSADSHASGAGILAALEHPRKDSASTENAETRNVRIIGEVYRVVDSRRRYTRRARAVMEGIWSPLGLACRDVYAATASSPMAISDHSAAHTTAGT
ncbi:hypothetical protein MYXA107069_14985 [Myxococcus xanthus]|nr:hypothetical protein MyxoNM_13505 [Myxococcus xanthus]SDW95266.1 hypothetical protein SAMN05444383_104328 [Myxococcus xanthus]